LSIPLKGGGVDFRLDFNSESKFKNVTSSSSLWLSRTPSFNPFGTKRFLVSAGYSTLLNRIDGEMWVLPDADLALKVSNNLALSGKIYGFSTEKDNPHVLGVGFHYFIGDEEKDGWVLSIQRADLKGLFSFKIKSFTLDIRKWIPLSILLFRIGLGSNYFKESTYQNTQIFPTKMEGGTNYLAIDTMLDIFGATCGLGFKFHPDRTFLSFFLQKEI